MPKRKKVIQHDTAKSHFIETLATGATVTDAAKSANVSPATVYRWRKADAEFEANWIEAYAIGSNALETEAQRRAVEGVEEGIYHQGRKCGTVRRYSDTLLMFLLKSRDPIRFCDRTRAANIMRHWAAEDAKDGDNEGTTAAAEAIAALERLASQKAETAKRPN